MFRPKRFPSSRAVIVTSSTVSIFSLYAYHQSTRQHLLTESSYSSKGYEAQSQLHGGKVGSITPGVFIWGRDSHNVASLGETDNEIVKRPKMVKAFEGMVLRDLQLHERYGVAVDEKGDVLQWGLGFTQSSSSDSSETATTAVVPLETSSPHLTLRNRNIVQVTLSDTKIYALSKKGEVYIFPVESELQKSGERSSGGLWAGILRWALWRENDAGVDVVKMKVDSGLKSGERITSLSSGSSHILALTSQSRALASPISLSGNVYGQLGVRKVLLNLPSQTPGQPPKEATFTLSPEMRLNDPKPLPPVPKNLDPLLLPASGKFPEPEPTLELSPIPLSEMSQVPDMTEVEQGSIRFCTTLHEIPALKGVRIVELKAGEKHSIARTREGRVLGWGANGYGQLGLGASLSLPFIPTPTEIPISRSFPKTSQISCSLLAAGGNLSYFVVNRKDLMDNGRESVELLATGNGQFGGVGNGNWAHVAVPTRVKTVSGLVEWSEEAKKVAPIDIREIAAGRTHVAVVLDNAVTQPGGIKFGRDVFVWGHNEFYQLGTGKRSNLSTPQHLPPLPYPGLRTKSDKEKEESLIESGTMSPMPHSRLQLAPEIKVKGKVVEETIVAGDGGTAVYWRILNP